MKKEEFRMKNLKPLFATPARLHAFLHSSFCLLHFHMNDLKFAFRQLLKNPGFTAVAVLTLAGEIGIVVAGLDVRVGIEVRLFLQEIQRAALLGQSGDVCGRQIVFPVGRAFQDQHSEMSIGRQGNVGRKPKPPPVFDFDWDCSHKSKIARKTRQPSLISGLRLSTLNSTPSQLL